MIEGTAAGTDLVQSSISYALPSEVENPTLTGGANANATGNALANVLRGNSGANLLTGAGNDDTLGRSDFIL